MKKALFLIVLCLFLPSLVFAETTGTIAGVILDGKTGDALIEAGVEVVETGKKVFTDIDGKYSIALPPGKYEIRVFYPQYRGQRVKDIVVNPGKPSRIDLALEPKTEVVEVVEVVVEAAKTTEATQLLIRKKAAAVTDSVSAETIAKQPDKDVASIVKRAPAVSVKDNKFIFIRGLGERYTSTTLNDTALPTTQRENKTVSLDMFSSGVVESINIMKSYTPDLPGEFAGGTARIDTKDAPDAFEMNVSAKLGFNSETTGKDFKTYEGGDWDWLTFDDGTRELSDSVPDRLTLPNTQSNQNKLREIAGNFSNIWSPKTEKALPSYGVNFHIGNKFDKFGIVFDMTYDSDVQTRKEDRIVLSSNGFGQSPNIKFIGTHDYFDKTYGWNAILNMSYALSPDDKISFKNFYARKAIDEVRVIDGFHNTDPIVPQKITRLSWSEESIYSTQISGSHFIPGLPLLTPIKGINSNIKWRLGYGRSTLDEPDTRETTYGWDEQFQGDCPLEQWRKGQCTGNEHPYELTLKGKSGSRRFTELVEDTYEAGVDWEIDLKGLLGHPLKVKFGPALSYRDRTFKHRIFDYNDQTGFLSSIDSTRPPESILVPGNIGTNGLEFVEIFIPSNHYEADHLIGGGYLMADTSHFFFENLRFVGGLRVEYSDQGVKQPDVKSPSPSSFNTENTDYFPAVNLIYSLSKDMNLRLSFSQTVNRPEFREISPFGFEDEAANVITIGNPDLKEALIKNYDLRWEWFLRSDELLALSFFYKKFTDPIERVLFPDAPSNRSTFLNANGANNYGIEVEARKSLGFIHPVLSPFSVFANYTYVDSEVDLADIKDIQGNPLQATSKQRPLQGQADHIANIILEYNNKPWDLTSRLLYNYVGEKIVEVGINGLPDAIEQPSASLDLILLKRLGKWGIKFEAKNLLDDKVEVIQGTDVVKRYKKGISATFKISYGI